MSFRSEHWQAIYRTKDPITLSWHQADARLSRALIAATGIPRTAAILDVGGGASLLVDQLLAAGHTDLTVLDIAADALAHAQRRLGPRAEKVTWLTADATAFDPTRRYRLWHDRAVFHFLADADDRLNYASNLRRALVPNGHVILATFGPNAPDRCSGLPVVRYDAAVSPPLLVRGLLCAAARPSSIAHRVAASRSSSTAGSRLKADAAGQISQFDSTMPRSS